MEDDKPEEKSPLLLYLVEGEGNPSRNNKRVNFDKGRLYGISSGATAVFTEFPNYISPCWITALLSSLVFFMLVMLMVSSMNYSNHLRVPRCTHSVEDLGNKSIHLVHLLSGWHEEELEILDKIKQEYENYNVNLILLRPIDHKMNDITKSLNLSKAENITSVSNSTAGLNQAVIEIKRAKRSKKSLRSLRNKREHANFEPLGIGFGVRNFLDILLRSRLESSGKSKRSATNNDIKTVPSLLENLTGLLSTTTPRPKTLDDVIKSFPTLTVKNVTFEEIFSKSPLNNRWFNLNQDLLIFAARILSLWQHGGLTFKMDGEKLEDAHNFSVAPDYTVKPPVESMHIQKSANIGNKLLSFILEGKRTFENLPKEVVTADDEALHIFTKSPCHAFFGEVLMNLRKANGDETVKNIIRRSLRVFCRHSSVGKDYCRNFVSRRQAG